MGRFWTAVRRLFSVYPADPRVRWLRRQLLASGLAAPAPAAKAVIAVQSVEDLFYFSFFSALLCDIRRSQEVRVDLVVVRAISGAIGVGWRASLMRSLPMTWLLSSQWVRAYRGWADQVGYRCESSAHPLGDMLDWWRSLRAWRQLQAYSGAPSLLVGGIEVGDLVNDSYLRFRPAPRFDAHDPFVRRLIWQAFRDVRRAQHYFGRVKPLVYLTTYATYLEHGVAVRVALAQGVRVVSFANFVRIGKQLTPEDPYHTHDCRDYKAVFDALDAQEQRLAQAEQQLRDRLGGGIDPATSYMRVSAYADQGVQAPPDVRGAVVIFLHDFYDSPHVYHGMVFGDFWLWICFTIDVLQQAGIRFFLKAHPNQIALSHASLHELNRAYPQLQFVPPGVTTVQLADVGMACGVTVYGTVAHELAYLGVPSIACARHPHTAFAICHTAASQAEYAALLRSSLQLTADPRALRHEALAFYYMHNLFGTDGELALRNAFVTWWKCCHQPESSEAEMLEHFDALRQSPALRAFARTLV
jgi:hypothetical protein